MGVVLLSTLTDCSGKSPFGTEMVLPPTIKDAVYVGWKTCLECHEDEHKSMERTVHGKVLATGVSRTDLQRHGCESCHAPKTLRADLKVETQLQLCGQCHQIPLATSYNWAHMPVREGKLQCADCHNVHGTITASLIPENSINEN